MLPLEPGSIYLSTEWAADLRGAPEASKAAAPAAATATSQTAAPASMGLARPLMSTSAQYLRRPTSGTLGGAALSRFDSAPLWSSHEALLSKSVENADDPAQLTQDVLLAMRSEQDSSEDEVDDEESDSLRTGLAALALDPGVPTTITTATTAEASSTARAGGGTGTRKVSLSSVLEMPPAQDSLRERLANQEKYILVLEDTLKKIQDSVRDACATQMPMLQLRERIDSIIRARPELAHLLAAPSLYTPLDLLLGPPAAAAAPSASVMSVSTTLNRQHSQQQQQQQRRSLQSPLMPVQAHQPADLGFGQHMMSTSVPSSSPSASPPIATVIARPSSQLVSGKPSRAGSLSNIVIGSSSGPSALAQTAATPTPAAPGSQLLFSAPTGPAAEESMQLRFVTSAPEFVPAEAPQSAANSKRSKSVSQLQQQQAHNHMASVSMGLSDESDPPEDVKGQVLQLAQYQAGCRFLQKQLDALEGARKAAFVQAILAEVLPVLPQVITDTYGQYLIPKLVEHCNDAQKSAVVAKLGPEIRLVACHSFGSHGLQRSLQFLGDEQVQLLSAALLPHVVPLCKDPKGNYLIQCFVRMFGPGSRVEFIFRLLTSELVDIAKHKVGCTVICRCLETADEAQTRAIVTKVLAHALPFARDEYANYVVQHIILHCAKGFSAMLINAYRGHATELCQQKFGSNVMEKCLEASDDAQFKAFYAELTRDSFLPVILSDQFGNFVLQKLLDLCNREQHASLVARIMPYLHSGHSPYAVHIEKKLMRR